MFFRTRQAKKTKKGNPQNQKRERDEKYYMIFQNKKNKSS